MKHTILILALLASCEGRCSSRAAVADAVPNAMCAVGAEFAICLKGSEVITCSVSGSWTNTASCTRLGALTKGGE